MNKAKIMFLFVMIFPFVGIAQDTIQLQQLGQKNKQAASSKEFTYYYEGKPFTGTANSYYLIGSKEFEISFHNGKKQGLETHWWESGAQANRMYYKLGIPIGPIRFMYENGRIYATGRGAEIKRENIIVIQDELSQKHHNINEPLIDLVSRDYFFTGKWKFYHENGKLMEIGSYLPYAFIEYFSSIDPESQMESIGRNIPEAVKNGWWQYYDEEGKPIKEVFYNNGNIVTTKQF